MCIDPDMPPKKSGELREHALAVIARLKAEGETLHPVISSSRALVSSFWAKTWVRHMGEAEIHGMRFAPGRTYLRNGCVIDLAVTRGHIRALVVGERLYEVSIDVKTPDEEEIELIRHNTAGAVTSWIDLLKGSLSEDILQTLCQPGTGILPAFDNIRCSCTCPDWADLCKHAAAALYGAAVKLDSEPELLFTLRGISMEQLVPQTTDTAAGALPGDGLSSIFGIKIDETP